MKTPTDVIVLCIMVIFYRRKFILSERIQTGKEKKKIYVNAAFVDDSVYAAFWEKWINQTSISPTVSGHKSFSNLIKLHLNICFGQTIIWSMCNAYHIPLPLIFWVILGIPALDTLWTRLVECLPVNLNISMQCVFL